MTTFTYEPVEFGYNQSTFMLKEIKGEIPQSPRVGDVDVLNWMLNLVANGHRLVIEPKGTNV